MNKLIMCAVLILAACSEKEKSFPYTTYTIELVDKVVIIEGRCEPQSAGDFFVLSCPDKTTTIRRSEIKRLDAVARPAQ